MFVQAITASSIIFLVHDYKYVDCVVSIHNEHMVFTSFNHASYFRLAFFMIWFTCPLKFITARRLPELGAKRGAARQARYAGKSGKSDPTTQTRSCEAM